MATAMAPCSATFTNAVDSFNTILGLRSMELSEIRNTSFHDLQKYLSTLQREQQKVNCMMHMKRLLPFLDVTQSYAHASRQTGGDFSFVAYVWGPMKFLLRVTSSSPDAFNALLNMYLEIGLNLPPLSQNEQLIQLSLGTKKSLVSVFEDVLELHLSLVNFFKQPTWDQFFPSTWRAFGPQIAHVQNVIQEYQCLVQRLLLDPIPNIESFAHEFQNSRVMKKLEASHARDAELRHQRITVQQWLCATDSELRQQDSSERRFGESGKWLLLNPRFRQWFDLNHCSDSLLWLKGMPGAGKTVLASLVIQEARKLAGSTVAFFYCKSSDEHKNGFLAVARGILSQLVEQNDALTSYIYETASTSSDAILSKEAHAKDLLELALNSCMGTYIIIDGLDEYSREDRKMISSYFQSIVHSIPKEDLGALRCLFVSQDDGYARKDLGGLADIEVSEESNREDIAAFCKYWHARLEGKFGCLNGMEHSITNVVAARSQGMFLFAKLVTWHLYEQTSKESLQDELEKLPEGLHQVYGRILDRILANPATTQSSQNNTRRLLGWLTCAKRPLKWYEIQGAMGLDFGNESVNLRLAFQDECKDVCASLVEISSDASVNFVHSTVKGYLIESGYVNEAKVEYDLAYLCLEYLACSHFDPNATPQTIEKGILSGFYSFADYAVTFWALHLENCLLGLKESSPEWFEELTEMLEVFLDLQWANKHQKSAMPNKRKMSMKPLEGHRYYQKVCSAISVQREQLRPTGRRTPDQEALWLSKSISRVRRALEAISRSPTCSADRLALITKLHGPHLFKCKRLSCQFFYRGFPTEAQRDQHVSKHERAFTCSEEGCPQSVIGCITAKDLQSHIFDSHGIHAKDEPEFPDDKDGVEKQKYRTQRHPATLQCSLCPKRFTRAFNLRSHLRTHTDERPFVCSVCGKAFSRKQDRLRHEGLHTGEKKFVCRGVLKTGNGWGCGSRFGRADALGRHFASEAGRLCIRPLLEEEAAEKGWHIPGVNEVDQAIPQPRDGSSKATAYGNFGFP